MSLILDALKKAEAERQRQSGPTLLEVRVTPPRRRLPLWTVVIGGLLALNTVLLLVFALRRPVATPGATPAPVAAAPAASAPVPATAAAAPAGPIAGAATAALIAPVTPPIAAAANRQATATEPSGAASTDSDHNPADDEPAIPARAGTVRSEQDKSASDRAADRASDRANSGEALPNLADLGGDMPNLRLDLHVYADRPASRYALINMHPVHEGDVLPEGPTVVEIYRDGVELSYHGTQFMLRPQ
jgi:general secretion pathway protein B